MRKQILLCVAACFLLTAFVTGCQTARKVNNAKTTAKKPAKNDAVTGQPKDSHVYKTASTRYYPPVYKPANAAPTAIIQPAANKVPEEKITTENTRIISIPVPQETVTQTNEKTVAENTPPTAAIQQPLNEKDTVIVVAGKPGKDENSDADPAATEEVAPYTGEVTDPLISKYAEMISVNRAEISNFSLYLFIDKWYGTKYRYGGNDSAGIDCSAFSQKLYDKVYKVDLMRTARQQHRHCERIKYPDDVNEGDLVFFRMHRLRISHVGIYLANGYFVHASSSKGVVISNMNNKYWQKRLAGCGRIAREEPSISESDYLQ